MRNVVAGLGKKLICRSAILGVPVIHTGPMTVKEFYSFIETRPDDGKWELIDGEPILNAWPSDIDETIELRSIGASLGLAWFIATPASLNGKNRDRSW
jgi:hypothetical protein